MGGKSDSLQSMQVRNQQPLSPGDTPLPTNSKEVEPPDEPEEEDEWWIDHSGPPSSDSEDEDKESNLSPKIVEMEPLSLENIACSLIPTIQITAEPWEDPDTKANRLLLSTMKE
jgi:hypothetical protein